MTTENWLNVPARINKNGRLQLIPKNEEETSVIDVAAAVKEGANYIIANKFSGILKNER
jgi:hypothetical protein